MRGVRWRRVAGQFGRIIAVWAVSTLTMLALAAVLPDFRLQSADGDSATRIAVTAACGAGAFGVLSAVVWPLLVRLLLLVPALVLGLLVFFLNGSLLLLALRINPSGHGEAAPETAVIVAAVMSAVASATGAALAVRDDEAYRRRLHRLAARRRRSDPPCPTTPGLVFVQLDGVGRDVLLDAVGKGLMPTVARWLSAGDGIRSTGDGIRPTGDGIRPTDDLCAVDGTRSTGDRSDVDGTRPTGDSPTPTHRLTPWRTDWSSQTGASQLGILHGSTFDVPAFRWYEKDRGEVMVCNRPTSAAELQRRAVLRTGSGGLLTVDGASRGNLFSGGAGEQALVLSIAARRRGRENRSRAGYFAYFSDPANAVRTALSFVAEVAREIGQSVRARIRGQRPRVSRGGLYPLVRAFATVVERDVVVAAVMGDMLAGRTAVYADLVAYDEVAHHSGPCSRDAGKVLQRLDRCLALLERVAEHSPRPYRIVVLSDHGQSPGETFRSRYGLTLADLVRAGCGLHVPRRAEGTRSGAEARAAVRAALRRPVEEKGEQQRPARGSEPIVLASGNLGLVSFPDVPHRLTKEEIDARHPALLTTLANHPGIGFVLVASEEHDGVVLGPHGAEIPLAELDDQPGPLARFGPGAADAVRRTHSFPHTADIMVNSAFDPADGEVLAFEEQIGSHGGLGGAQSRPFLLSPLELSAPAAGEEEPAGAEQVHRILRRWLDELNGPQVPLTDTGDGGTETARPAPAPAGAEPADAEPRGTEDERAA
ncbi:phage holin family protein [Streptomyces sp. NBC_00557]|uniref:phage holin family protein n=1 Tax=Streptomyces sp. NBC_00557 TaxID=2975776 RepID=UPI002E82407E|nr:phage holin family protein [Streptomyces sp. NBC_00557]WUC33811.1 alkaline phosphatase family protein [Streptomyces sp. NBC_00557]